MVVLFYDKQKRQIKQNDKAKGKIIDEGGKNENSAAKGYTKIQMTTF